MDLFGLGWLYAIWGTLLCVATSAASVLCVGFLLIRLPATFFLESYQRGFSSDQHALVRWSGKIAKNLCGVVLILIGIIMSLPGVPGQGLLTILIGLILVDFPGKHRAERWLIGRRGVAHKINRLRAKFGRPPLVLEEPAGASAERDAE